MELFLGVFFISLVLFFGAVIFSEGKPFDRDTYRSNYESCRWQKRDE